MGYVISYADGRFKQLSKKYKRVVFLQKDNADIISKIVNYKMNTRYEDMYGIYLDSEDGVFIFAHSTMICIGAASTDNIEYASVIGFETVKSLLTHEMDFWKMLVERWENENDVCRANMCKERVQELKKIIDTRESDWKDLLSL